MDQTTITLTFGEVAENHARMQKIGTEADSGFTHSELKKAARKFQRAGYDAKLLCLNEALPKEERPKSEPAYLLVVRKGINLLLQKENQTHRDLFQEHSQLNYDTQAKMRGRVVNKHARHNLCFAEQAQEPDYEGGKGRIIPFSQLPLLRRIRRRLPRYLGPKAKNLLAESNLYYDVSRCGIGYHGDSERKKVIGLRIGAEMPLHYQWYRQGEPVGKKVRLTFQSGDLYVMSEKATGNDWKRRSILTLRHAAGSPKYVGAG